MGNLLGGIDLLRGAVWSLLWVAQPAPRFQ